MKKVIGIIVIMVIACATYAQTLFNNNATAYMSLSINDKRIYFSSMEWFNTVDCYDENGKQIFHTNVKIAAKRQISQFVEMSFDGFEDGDYIIVLRNNKNKMVATLKIFNNSTSVQLYDTN